MEYKTRSEYIYDNIKEDIINGKLNLGERLLINDLAKQYSVSAVPVREALNRLLQDGLVEMVANVGAKISALNREKYLEIFFVKFELEAIAFRMAAEAATDELVAKLEGIIAEMEDSLENNDLTLYAKLNRRFHLTIDEANPNKFLYETLVGLWNRTDLTRRAFTLSLARDRESLAEHKEILQAIRDRDGALVAQIFRRQKANSAKFYTEHFPLWGF